MMWLYLFRLSVWSRIPAKSYSPRLRAGIECSNAVCCVSHHPCLKTADFSLGRALFCPCTCHLQGLNLICDYKVMRLAFKQTTEPVTLDERWPSKMTPCLAGCILTPKGLPPQPLGMKFPYEKHLRDNQLITRRK